MFVPIQRIIDAHTAAGYTLQEIDDDSSLTFERGIDMCFHLTYRQSRVETQFVVEDDRRWNQELADQLEAYFEGP